MGTTAEKLTYLNDTKGLLKDSINSLGGEITSQTTFRQYVTELDSIYSNLPKVSGTGSILSLSPTLKGRLGSVLKGNTLQDGTPTPDSPVEIQSATGTQKVIVSGKNLFDKDNVNILNANLNNQKINSANAERTVWFKCEPNTTYTFTKLLNSPYTRNAIAETTDIPTINMTIQNFENYVNSPTFTYTTSETAKYLVWWFYNTSSTNYTQQELLDSIQVELGTQATEYEPYQSQEYDINLGKNLLQTTQESYTFEANTNTTLDNIGTIYLEANKKYYITYNIDNATTSNTRNTPFVRLGSASRIYQSATSNYNLTTGRKTWEYTPSESGNYNIGYWCVAPDIDLTVSDFMISKSNDITYSPYFTPIKLNKIGDYQDYITGTPNNWVLHKNIGKINIIVNSTITSWGGRHWIGFNKPSDSIMHGANNFNRYKLYMEKAYYSNTNDAIYSYQTGLAAYAMGVMCNENDDPTTLKNKLDGSLMYYPLKEETTEAITNQEIINQLNEIYYLQSYNGTTNITITSEDLELIMTASAIKGEA